MYKKILVPISFDDDEKVDRSIAAARAMADDDATITLLHVVEHVPAYAIYHIPDDLMEATREGLAKELQRLASDVPHGEGMLVEGHAGRTILDTAEEVGTDCIVIASHRPGMQDYLLGSTAAQVVRHAPCTVVVVR